MKKILTFIFLMLVVTTLTSCIVVPTDGIINQKVETLEIGEKTVLSLSKEVDGVVWSSSDDSIATVDSFGVVTGISGGIATITATVDDKVYSVLISVDAKKSDPIITLSGNQTIFVEETTQLKAYTYNSENEVSVLWSSSDDTIASVDSNGLVTGLNTGMVTITAKTVTDRLVEAKITILVRSENGILEDTINNYIESNTVKIEGNLDLTALNKTTVDVIKNNYESTIGVSNYSYYTSWNGSKTLELSGIGTGVIFKRELMESGEYMYYALTNYHVVENYDVLKVYLGDKDLEIQCNNPLNSKTMDLAVVAFRYDGDIPLAKIGNIEDVKAGDFVIALGNPTGYEYYGSATFGMVSYVNRELKGEQSNFIQHDAAINPGNSGGPLFNMKGEVIGINTIKLADEDIDNMGFSVAVDTIRHFLKSGGIVFE